MVDVIGAKVVVVVIGAKVVVLVVVVEVIGSDDVCVVFVGNVAFGANVMIGNGVTRTADLSLTQKNFFNQNPSISNTTKTIKNINVVLPFLLLN